MLIAIIGLSISSWGVPSIPKHTIQIYILTISVPHWSLISKIYWSGNKYVIIHNAVNAHNIAIIDDNYDNRICTLN